MLKVYANKLWVYDRERYKGKRAVQDVPRTAMKPGSFTVSGKGTNSFKVRHDGSAKTVVLTLKITGGMK